MSDALHATASGALTFGVWEATGSWPLAFGFCLAALWHFLYGEENTG